MKSMNAWDLEARRIASEIDQLHRQQRRSQPHDRQALIALKMSIHQLQALIGQTMERATQVEKRKDVLAPIEGSLLHWGQLYLQKLSVLYAKRVECEGKHMWMKLLRTRLPGSKKANLAISDDHLIEMSMREKNMQQTERYLTEQHNQLLRQKKQLTQKYEQMSARLANREAAGSLAVNFGTSPAVIARNPFMAHFSNFLRKIGNCTHFDKSKSQEMRQYQTSIQAETDRIMRECQSIAVSETEYPRSTKGRLRKYEKNLKHIEDLQLRINGAAERLHTPPAPARPILLKKSSIRAIT